MYGLETHAARSLEIGRRPGPVETNATADFMAVRHRYSGLIDVSSENRLEINFCTRKSTIRLINELHTIGITCIIAIAEKVKEIAKFGLLTDT